MSLRHWFGPALVALAISACSGDDGDPSVAGSGAGASPAGGQGGEAATTAGSGGSSGSSGTHAGEGGTAAGTSAGAQAGTSAGSAGLGGTGGMAGTSAGTGGTTLDAGADSGSDAGPELEGCVVARRLDECCPMWAAVSRADAYADPCLHAIGEPLPSGGLAQGCTPEFCPDVLCVEQQPPSRVAEPFGASGECGFADECHAEGSCAVGWDMTGCCPCPGSQPQILIDSEPCVIGETETANDLPAGCYKPCPVECGVCPGFSPPICAIGDALNACL